MTVCTLPPQEAFATTPVRGLPTDAKVDRKTRTIYGAKAMQFGALNEGDARPWKVDDVTLQQLAAAVNAKGSGAKMRFAHPNMSRDGMGRHLGRATNARVVGEGEASYVAIDAKLSNAATRAPGGNLADHVLDLAEETPEDFGLSIAPRLDLEAMNKIEPDENGLRPIRIKELRAIDFVDEPAATRGGLFSLDSDSLADLPAQATALLDTFFGEATPDVIRGRFNEFLETYFRSKGEPMTSTEHAAELAAKQAEIDALKAQLSSQSIHPVNADEAAKAREQATAKAELSRRSELTALCALAKVSDADRDLMIAAGFSRADAQDWLKSSGKLSAINPPLSEGGNDLSAKQAATPDEKYGQEFDATPDIFTTQGLTREAYIRSRKVDDGLIPLAAK